MSDINWKHLMANGVSSVRQLASIIPLSEEEREEFEEIVSLYPMLIPRYYLDLIDPEDPDDPIRRTIVPSPAEFDESGLFDTSGESENTKLVGLQHKYPQTALILSTNVCAAYCRYCFRKRFVGTSAEEVIDNFQSAIAYVRQHPEIDNVLISGGDSLTLDTPVIRRMLEMLDDIDHVKLIRFGTKTPIVLPQRFTTDPGLIRLFRRYSRPDRRIYLVTQFSHPRELSPETRRAIRLLQEQARVTVSNQTVLMRGVNDDPEVLAELMASLAGLGVIPYYVFQCRPVKHVKAYFQVPLEEGAEIVEEAKKLLNGHAKRFKYCMSHKTGKIEILGELGGEMVFKYHQAKDIDRAGRLFSVSLDPGQGWLGDIEFEDEDEGELSA